MSKKLFVISFLLLLFYAHAQDGSIIYTTKDGLCNNYINKTVQDKYGFLWIATTNGLSKFDGRKFYNYKHKPSDTNSLRSNWVTDLLVDNDGTLWVTTEWGICKYNYWADNFSYLNKQNDIYVLYKAPLCLDSLGNKWMAAENGLFYIDKTDNKVHKTSVSVISDPQSILYHNYQLYITTRGNGLYCYDINSATYKKINIPVVDEKTHLIQLYKHSNALWLATEKGLVVYEKNNFKLYNKLNNRIIEGLMSITQSSENNHQLYIGTYNNEVFVFDTKSRSFIQAIPQTIIPKAVHNHFFTQQSNTWISTDRGLIKTFYHKNKQQEIYNINLPKNITNNLITHIVAGKENTNDLVMLAGRTNAILVLYNRNNQQYKILNPNAQYNTLIKHQNKYCAASFNTIDFYKEDYTYLSSIKHHYKIISACSYNDSLIVFGTDKGLVVLNTNYKTITPYLYSFNGTTIENNSFTDTFPVSAIIKDYNNTIWLASIKYGLFAFDIATKKYTAHRQSNQLLYNTHNRIAHLAVDKNNNLWLATMGGLSMFNTKQNKFTNYNIDSGLTSSYIYSVLADNNNDIWGRGNEGIFKYSTHNKYFTNLFLTDEENKLYFKQTLSLLKEGVAYGFENGFSVLQLNDNTKHLDSVVINYVKINKLDKPLHNYIQLKHYQNNFQISFTAANLNNPQKYNYKYRLVGLHNDWQTTESDGFATYNNLPPGQYTFEVMAKNGTQLNSLQQIFSFTIQKAFWQTYWFITLFILTIIFVLIYVIRWWQKQHVQVAIEKAEKEKLKAQQLQADLELEQVSYFFANTIAGINNIDELLWAVAKNLIGKLGFVDCMIYLWNEDKTKLIQKAGYGPKGSIEEINKLPFDVVLGQGVVGYVAQIKEAVIIPDTSIDERYRVDEMVRLSEICLPIMDGDELIGIIDSEHPDKNFYTNRHLKLLTTISTLIVNKIKSIQAKQEAAEKSKALQAINKQNAELQLAALRSQMNPHFIFNSLNSIQKYIWNNNQEDASEYLTSFAKLMRLILEHSSKKLIPLQHEIEALQLYLELEHRRSNNKFDYSFKINDQINTANILIPPLLMQPHIENAIWHGLLPKTDRGKLTVELNILQNEILECVIEDNGIGRKKSAEINQGKHHKPASMATKITQERLSLANTLGLTGSINIIDLYNPMQEPLGTKVILQIPIEFFNAITN